MGWSLAGAAAALVLAATGPGAGIADGVMAAGRSAAASAADLIRHRSPGLRSSAYLTKTKHARAPRYVAPRQARALPRVRAPAAAPLALLAPPPPETPLVFADQGFAPEGPVLITGPFPAAFPVESTPCFCSVGSGPPLIGGGGLVISSGGGGGVVIPPPTQSPPSVPEPAAWTMMIVGFGLMGAAWRRRKLVVAFAARVPMMSYARIPLLSYAPDR